MVLLQILAGLLLLFVGGEALVRGAVKIAKEYNISKLIIGVTIVAFGTSSPELLITLQATLKGLNEIALGNVVGSNIANSFLVLGIASILFPIKVDKALLRFDMPYMIVASFVLFAFVFTGYINRWESLVLLLILAIYTFTTLRRHKNLKDDAMNSQVDEFEDQFHFEITHKRAIWMIVLGTIALAVGGDILVSGASKLAVALGVSDAAIAVTIVAIGGSAPELATSTIAAYRKHSDIAIANVIGSNIFNILGVLGLSTLVKPIVTHSTTIVLFDIWVLVFSAMLLFSFSKRKNKISRGNGIVFLIFYAIYISWQFMH